MTQRDALIQDTHAPIGNSAFFTLLADKHNSPGYFMESTVLAREVNKRVWKIYDTLDVSVLARYHHIHNQLSQKEYTRAMDGTFEYLGTPIYELVFRVHPLGNEIRPGSDISSKKSAVITELEYVPGVSLTDGTIRMPKNFLTTPWNDMDAFLSQMDYELFGLPLRQLRSPNIKIKEFDSEKGKLSLVITDLGGSIERFVEHMRQRDTYTVGRRTL